ncbi:hypothetical protein M011DRAFT_28590 [Sporormia fimetaria CBS 119925]|uniref:Lytic polysaccharide monooxygenase n=1 Tax=Sporormia fimetaria CBS 119925 TaxID=1340428 RepID=A0A6A6VBQ9_9PLEO|nr:hypothetical protein M011DRAFT_28590 [Sporormia fimetaria CBS 119925]
MQQITLKVGIALCLVVVASTSASGAFPAFNITAIASRGGCSILQCWQLASPPVEARSAINFAIGESTRATWSIIEPRIEVGEAWALTPQLTIVLNGLVRITAPFADSGSCQHPNNSSGTCIQGHSGVQRQNTTVDCSCPESTTAYFMPGTLRSSLLLAADTRALSYIRGHETAFPSSEDTVLVQTPFLDGVVPEHRVLHEGPCVRGSGARTWE